MTVNLADLTKQASHLPEDSEKSTELQSKCLKSCLFTQTAC